MPALEGPGTVAVIGGAATTATRSAGNVEEAGSLLGRMWARLFGSADEAASAVARSADNVAGSATHSGEALTGGIPSGWKPVNGVDAQVSTPPGFTSYTTPAGDIVHVSPGGLRYGSDPQFGNRVYHVLDHTVANPNKPVHSVFNVQGDDALALVDQAWARRGAPDPIDPFAFVVDMGRRIGTAGETRIRIVTMTPGGSEIRTAYPWP